MNGTAPKFPLTGSQSLPVKNLQPNLWRERPEPLMSSIRMKPTIVSTQAADNQTTLRKKKSASRLARLLRRGTTRTCSPTVPGFAAGPIGCCGWSTDIQHTLAKLHECCIKRQCYLSGPPIREFRKESVVQLDNELQ